MKKEITWIKILVGYGLMAVAICGFTACQIDQLDNRLKRIESTQQPRTLYSTDTVVVDGDTLLIEKYIRSK